ncbi:hypothetical protein QBC43DRAFT_339523 [Cladorrhinum sp. PSN259]|nr:hypothetical protein QBC43DRAFT_339523 [Cladorrhinum sp. PSN259]
MPFNNFNRWMVSSSFAYNGSFCSNSRHSEESQSKGNGRLVIIRGNWSHSRDFTPEFSIVCNPTFSVQKREETLARDMNGDFTALPQVPVSNHPDSEADQIFLAVTPWTLLTESARTLAESQQSLSLGMESLIEAAITTSLRKSKDPTVFQAALSDLFGQRFSSRVEQSDDGCRQTFTIEKTRSIETGPLLATPNAKSTEDEDGSVSNTKLKWYREFPVTIPGQVLILGAFPILFIGLELLYQHSARDNGLATVQISDTAAYYSRTYLPSAVMVGMSLLLGSLSMTAKVIDPYHILRKGNAPANTTISENHLRYIGVSALWNALRKRRWAVVTAGLAGLIAPFLTIITSGLFLTEPSALTGLTKVTRFESFNLSATDGATGLRYANMILSNNISDLTWTYQDLAHPRLQLDDVGTAAMAAETPGSIGSRASLLVTISSPHGGNGNGNGQSDPAEPSSLFLSHVPDFFDELDEHYSFLRLMANVGMSFDADLGGMFPVVVYGRNGTPMADMVSPENVHRLRDTLETAY